MRNKFKLPIGDWSGDGHGQCDYYIVSTNKSYVDVINAFNTASELFPEYDPRTFCNEYDAYEPPDHIAIKIGLLDPNHQWGEWEFGFLTPDTMANYTIWFINQGDPDLDLKLEPEDHMHQLHFGYNKAAGTGFIGYGLFNS